MDRWNPNDERDLVIPALFVNRFTYEVLYDMVTSTSSITRNNHDSKNNNNGYKNDHEHEQHFLDSSSIDHTRKSRYLKNKLRISNNNNNNRMMERSSVTVMIRPEYPQHVFFIQVYFFVLLCLLIIIIMEVTENVFLLFS